MLAPGPALYLRGPATAGLGDSDPLRQPRAPSLPPPWARASPSRRQCPRPRPPRTHLLGTKAGDWESGAGARGRASKPRGAREAGELVLGRQQPGPASNLQVRTHLRIWPAAVRSPAASRLAASPGQSLLRQASRPLLPGPTVSPKPRPPATIRRASGGAGRRR